MNCLNQLTELLSDLKENYNILGLKSEFEDEGASFDEALALSQIAGNANLKMSLKIGGCGSVKDLFDAKKINANIIVAPMIETSYALKKFVKNVKSVFPDSEADNKKFFINIETVSGIKNLESIISDETFANISGIVLGRADLTASLNLSKADVNSEIIYNSTKIVSEAMKEFGKDFIVGGGVFEDSQEFFKELPYITAFETRKIIFDGSALDVEGLSRGIMRAVEFEITWLKNKGIFGGTLSKRDYERIKTLESKCHLETKLP